MNKGTVLIVEDEKGIAESLSYNLNKDGFRSVVVNDGAKALDTARRTPPDIILLDWMLPKVEGIEVCRILKQEENTKHIPIIMLTVKSTETDKVLGLEMGADDYVTKPFSPRELIARIKAILRRVNEPPVKETFELGDVHIDWAKHVVRSKGKEIELTAKEFELLKAFIESHGRVLTREILLDKVWGYERSMEIETRTVDLHISQLRKKIKSFKDRIVTLKGVGYRFILDE